MILISHVVESNDIAEPPSTFKHLGEIRVSLYRVYQTPLTIPKERPIVKTGTVTQVSEKLLKGQAIENSIRWDYPFNHKLKDIEMKPQDYRCCSRQTP
jgi:hypothetical protein